MPKSKPKTDSLERYRAKRKAGATPEPGVGPAPLPGADSAAPRPVGLFVVHKHAASRLHFDLRLEFGGALMSWAVPKGPSLDPGEKRLAVHVEDHPLEYVDFEDVIPDGNYGAGPMIIWDRGTWVALEDPGAGLEDGKLLFELRGHKLRGVWTLVKLKKTEKEWLLIRETRTMSRAERAAAAGADESLRQESILSGLTVEELGAGVTLEPRLAERLDELEVPKKAVRTESVKLMLAHTAESAWTDPEWLFELKLDGYRMLASRSGPRIQIRTRNGNDATPTFPELARALKALPVGDFILDGEVVLHDEAGHPSFQRLQNRARVRRPIDIKRASLRRPATFYSFDVLSLQGRDLRSLPLRQRKAILREVLPPTGPIRYVDHFDGVGEALYAQVLELRLEGIIGKRADSKYRGGRSRQWLKVRAERSDDFVIVGYTEPKGSRPGFGALHLAAWKDEPPPDTAEQDENDVGAEQSAQLVYAGRVGTGFSDAQLREIRALLDSIETEACPLAGGVPGPASDTHTWVRPELVAEVRYLEWTDDRLLRHPTFARLRDDKQPGECVMLETLAQGRPGQDAERDFEQDSGSGAGSSGSRGTAGGAGAITSTAPEMGLSNPDKIFWPEEEYTKRDLFEFYRAVSPWLLPYLADRPLVLTRYPDGIDGKSFYQKNAPVSTPEWLRTESIQSERSEDKVLDYFVCDDEASLLYLANLGTIPLHVWASRVGTIDRPDWCILDLDPKGAPFADVVKIARLLHDLCADIDLPCFVKTSGSTGLHVLVPLGGQFSYEQSRTLGELLARVALQEAQDIATITRNPAKRQGKVYIDYLQNRRGQLLAAPFSVRPVPGALVSTPLRWREVTSGLDMRRFTIRSVPKRLSRMTDEPMLPVLDLRPDLPAVLSRLGMRFKETS
ncbi:MAG: DNA ligase D [Gemmatimonadota bacterium]